MSSNHAWAKNVRVPPGRRTCATARRRCATPGTRAFSTTRRCRPFARRAHRRPRHGCDGSTTRSSRTRRIRRQLDLRGRADRRVYGPSREVIHPPVDVAPLLQPPAGPHRRLSDLRAVVPYKWVDLAVQACRRLGRRVIVAGSGRDLDRVRAVAGREADLPGMSPMPSRLSSDQLPCPALPGTGGLRHRPGRGPGRRATRDRLRTGRRPRFRLRRCDRGPVPEPTVRA